MEQYLDDPHESCRLSFDGPAWSSQNQNWNDGTQIGPGLMSFLGSFLQ